MDRRADAQTGSSRTPLAPADREQSPASAREGDRVVPIE